MDQGIIRSMKAHYGEKVLMRMITAIDRGDDLSISSPEALQLINAAWNAATRATLANCFQKGGFFRESGEPPAVLASAASDDEQMLEHVAEQRHIFRDKGATGLDGVTAADFLNTDEAVETSAELITE